MYTMVRLLIVYLVVPTLLACAPEPLVPVQRLQPRVELVGNTLSVQALGAFAAPEGTRQINSNLSLNLSGLKPNQRYWLYTLASTPLLVDVTPPAPSMTNMDGDASALLLSTFYTDGAAQPLTYTQIGSTYVYTMFSSTRAGDGNLSLLNGRAERAEEFLPGPSIPDEAVLTTVSILGVGLSGAVTVYSDGAALQEAGKSLSLTLSSQGYAAGHLTASARGRFSYHVSDGMASAATAWAAGFSM